MEIGLKNSDGSYNSTLRGVDGGALVYNTEEQAPVTTETRRNFALTAAAATDAIIIGAATPTVADGTDLIAHSSFTNSPKRIHAIASGERVAASLIGWIFVINAASAAAAGAAINTAFNATGAAIAAASPVQADTDAQVFFVPLNGEIKEKFDAVITSIHMAPASVDATPAITHAYCHLKLLP